MSNSTITFDPLVHSQAGKETTANAMFDALSPASIFGRRASTSTGLTWGYYGGVITINGALITIANGTLALSASATNYVEVDPQTGAVSKNTTAFTPGRIPLYSITANTTSITGYTDYRISAQQAPGRLAKAMTDANTTLTNAEARNEILEFTGTLTAARNIVLPLGIKQYTVFNNTTGGFGLQFIGGTGTGITVAATKRAIIYADGTNVVRVTADA